MLTYSHLGFVFWLLCLFVLAVLAGDCSQDLVQTRLALYHRITTTAPIWAIPNGHPFRLLIFLLLDDVKPPMNSYMYFFFKWYFHFFLKDFTQNRFFTFTPLPQPLLPSPPPPYPSRPPESHWCCPKTPGCGARSGEWPTSQGHTIEENSLPLPGSSSANGSSTRVGLRNHLLHSH